MLLYGNNEVEFENVVAGEDVDANEVKPFRKEYFLNAVSNEIYLNLQEDEVEFTDELFKQVYYEIIHQLNQSKSILVDAFINHSNTAISNLVTNILMDDEKHAMSNWERKEIKVKSKESNLSKMVLDAIYNLRRVLIEEKINSLSFVDYTNEDQRTESMEAVMNYTSLKLRLSGMLNRVV